MTLGTCIAALWMVLGMRWSLMSHPIPSLSLKLKAVISHCIRSPSGKYIFKYDEISLLIFRVLSQGRRNKGGQGEISCAKNSRLNIFTLVSKYKAQRRYGPLIFLRPCIVGGRSI